MQKFFTLGLLCFVSTLVSAQAFQEINTGSGYNKQSFVKLSTGTEKLVANDAWDIAFTAFGNQDAGIFINEASGSSMGQNLPLTELYIAPTTNFADEITATDLVSISQNKYLNSEKSWSYGAFNEVRDTLKIFDYGWGSYNPAIQQVVGNKVYVLKLRSGAYKKIKIESLAVTTYTIKYANIDGTQEVTKTINKTTDNKGQKMIFFSFATNETVDVLPAGGFDLMYCRYIALAKDPNGTLVQQYNVTGVLTGFGVSAVMADGITPATVSYNDYKNNLSTKTDVVGYDWKTLAGTSWTLDQDRVYFVKTADKNVWKIRFIDFEGSSTGKAVFEKTDLGNFSASEDLSGIETIIYPNPVNNELFVSFDAKEIVSNKVSITVTDISGRIIHNQNLAKVQGFNVFEINTSEWQKGMYLVSLTNRGQKMRTEKIVKN